MIKNADELVCIILTGGAVVVAIIAALKGWNPFDQL